MGTLSNGMNYVVGSMNNRDRLSLIFSKPGSLNFICGYGIRNGYDPKLDLCLQFSGRMRNGWSASYHLYHANTTSEE